jgi:hypothetical protein
MKALTLLSLATVLTLPTLARAEGVFCQKIGGFRSELPSETAPAPRVTAEEIYQLYLVMRESAPAITRQSPQEQKRLLNDACEALVVKAGMGARIYHRDIDKALVYCAPWLAKVNCHFDQSYR